MSNFIPGLALNRLFYSEAVKPILDTEFPGLRHSAARLGSGSEVLGYDDEMSTDHDWGPRLQIFLSDPDHASLHRPIADALSRRLPHEVHGYSTHFGPANVEGTRLLGKPQGLVAHRVEITTLAQFVNEYLGIHQVYELTPVDWLTMPQQLLLGITKGEMYRDDLGELAAVRAILAYYPRDVWLYLLACQWARIGQEEHFVARTGWVGDELGSKLLAAQLVHDLMLLCFLMERTYAPYPKWFGTAFAKLKCSQAMMPLLEQVVSAEKWRLREQALCAAFELAARLHNGLGITRTLSTEVESFHSRPFKVIGAERFVQAIRDQLEDPVVKAFKFNIGSIDQYSHSTDLRSNQQLHRRLSTLYD